MTSVAALTPTASIASHPPLFNSTMLRHAASSTSGGQTRRFAAVVTNPVPSGLVSTSTSPGRAVALVRILSG